MAVIRRFGIQMLSSSSKNQQITSQGFSLLLARLDDDPEVAGEAYEEQRRMLVKFFECRGCSLADELADESLDRVMRRLDAGVEIENISSYAFGVARLLLLEWRRSPETKRIDLESLPPLAAPPPSFEEADDVERHVCLESCLQKLPAESRALLLEYYRDERRAKIDVRQTLADRLSLRRNALTKRVVRLREKLEACIVACVKKKTSRAAHF